MSNMNDEELKAIEARANAAAPGPWKVRYSQQSHVPGMSGCLNTCGKGQVPDYSEPDTRPADTKHLYPNPSGQLHGFIDRDTVEDVAGPDGPVFSVGQDYDEHGYVGAREAEFAAHARQDVPALIAEVRRLQAVIKMAEWKGHDDSEYCCPWCGGWGYKPTDHADDCAAFPLGSPLRDSTSA